MDNDALEQRLNSLLSSPDSLAQIGQLLGSLGQISKTSPESEPTPPTEPRKEAEETAPMPDLMRFLPLLSGLSSDTDDARLLRALKPYLHGERRGRLDGAIRMVQLSRMLPLLKGGGETGG